MWKCKVCDSEILVFDKGYYIGKDGKKFDEECWQSVIEEFYRCTCCDEESVELEEIAVWED